MYVSPCHFYLCIITHLMRMISNDLLELQSCGTTSTFTVLLIEKCVILYPKADNTFSAMA